MGLPHFALVAALLLAGVASAAGDAVTSPVYALHGLPGRIDWQYNVMWRYIKNSDASGGDFVAIKMEWAAGRYAAVGFSPYNMHGYITACNVPAADPSAAVCTDVIGHNGGGVTRNPNQYSRLLWAKVGDAGFVEAEIEVPVSAVNITMDAKGHTRLIFAASTWNSTNNMPEPHGAKGKCILHVGLKDGSVSEEDYPIATAASHVFQPFSNYQVWWYVVMNGTNNMNSYLRATFQITGSNWVGMGFASEGMTGRIIICRYDTSASCGDYDGHDFGIKKAANQVTEISYNYVSGGKAYIGVHIPLTFGAYILKSPAGDIQNMINRTIFATSTWDSKRNFPNPHNASSHAIRRVDFFRNEVFTTAYSNYFETFPGYYYTAWALLSTGAGYNTLKLRVSLLIADGYFAGFGFANVSMGGPLVACHTPTNNSLGVVCRDFIGQATGGVVVNPVQSTLTIAAIQGLNGYTEAIVDIDLAKFNVTAESAMNNYQRVIQAYGHWDSAKMMPTYHGPNATYWHVNLNTFATNGTNVPSSLPPMTNSQVPLSDFTRKLLQGDSVNLVRQH